MLRAFLERPPEPQDTNALSGGLEPLCSFQLTGVNSPCVQGKASSDCLLQASLHDLPLPILTYLLSESLSQAE